MEREYKTNNFFVGVLDVTGRIEYMKTMRQVCLMYVGSKKICGFKKIWSSCISSLNCFYLSNIGFLLDIFLDKQN